MFFKIVLCYLIEFFFALQDIIFNFTLNLIKCQVFFDRVQLLKAFATTFFVVYEKDAMKKTL